jgi:hypothetical protein
MSAFEFIIFELKSFINDFSKTRVRYEFDNLSNTHFIEVVPNEVYHLDNLYIRWESNMFDRFVQNFPDQNICFISDDAIVGLDRIDFELSGKAFVSFYTTNIPELNLDANLIQVNNSINNGPTPNITVVENVFPTAGKDIAGENIQTCYVDEFASCNNYSLAA